MALQAIKEREAYAWQVHPVIKTVAGFGNAQSLMAFSDNYGVGTLVSSGLFSTAPNTVFLGCTYFAGTSDYDPDFVASILQADASAPEATFNNVVDMLDWLNRE